MLFMHLSRGIIHHRICERLANGKSLRRYRSNVPEKKNAFPYPTIYDEFPTVRRFYHFDKIHILNTLSSLKLITVPIMGIIVGGHYFLVENGYLEQTGNDSGVRECSFMYSLCLLLTIPTINFVGSIYVDEDTGESVLSYIDFWGNRLNERFPQGDLYFKSRCKGIFKHASYMDVMWVHLVSRSSGRKFKVHIRYADIEYQGTVEELFGNIPEYAF